MTGAIRLGRDANKKAPAEPGLFIFAMVDAYFFICFARNSCVRVHARSAASLR
jgi:hypothetical protein